MLLSVAMNGRGWIFRSDFEDLFQVGKQQRCAALCAVNMNGSPAVFRSRFQIIFGNQKGMTMAHAVRSIPLQSEETEDSRDTQAPALCGSLRRCYALAMGQPSRTRCGRIPAHDP